MGFVMLIIGLCAGCMITLAVIRRFYTSGILRVDCSDPDDGPYLFLEVSKELSSVLNKKFVIFTVCLKDFIPRK